jgi:hypothetical protein
MRALVLILLLALLSTARAADFEPLFNGYDLRDWTGDTDCWSVRDGNIVGHSPVMFGNTFLVWKGKVGDFILKARVRLTNGNSGIQYRSRDLGRHVVSGYQAEIANEPGAAGFLYEEKGRKFLAFLGQGVRLGTGGRDVYATFGTKNDFLAWKYYRPGDWNDYLIVAKGSYLAHYVNGFKTIELIDEDSAHRASEGVLALQLHAGLPMTVEFRELLLKRL